MKREGRYEAEVVEALSLGFKYRDPCSRACWYRTVTPATAARKTYGTCTKPLSGFIYGTYRAAGS